jgi:signal transduction histidine kinase
LVADERGALWLYTQCGIVQIDRAELQRWWADPEAVVKRRVLDAFDGVQPGSAPFVGGARSTDGRLWFANGLVLQMLDPARLTGNRVPPPVQIEEVVVDGARQVAGHDMALPARIRDLQIDYTALSFIAPQKVRFRYKLEGRDSDWQEAGGRRQAFYSDPAPGAYTFRVIAANNDGVWNEQGASLVFTVAAAWYQTAEFALLSVVSSGLLVWVLIRLRVRYVTATIKGQFDERLAERTRIARELHDTLLQSLQACKMAADHALRHAADDARMTKAMQQLSDWLGRAVQEGRAALLTLRVSTTETNDLADALRRVTEDGLPPEGMAISFAVPAEAREIHPIVRDEVYRIAYEAIRNALAHSKATRLEIELRYERSLTVRVSDNGIGIDADMAQRGRDGHFGLQGMRERAARLGATFSLVSLPGNGTTITVIVPADVAFRVRANGAPSPAAH